MTSEVFEKFRSLLGQDWAIRRTHKRCQRRLEENCGYCYLWGMNQPQHTDPAKNSTEPFRHIDRALRRKKMADRVRKGASLSEVAQEFKVSLSSVKAACLEHDVEPARRAAPNVTALDVVAALLKGEETQSDVARRLGISRQRVHQIVVEAKKAGIKLKTRPTR